MLRPSPNHGTQRLPNDDDDNDDDKITFPNKSLNQVSNFGNIIVICIVAVVVRSFISLINSLWCSAKAWVTGTTGTSSGVPATH